MGAGAGPEVSIRCYRPGDIDQLHAIDRICFDESIAYSRAELLYYLRHPRAVGKVAERAASIVGFALGRIEEKLFGHVITLDVMPEARRCGIGAALLESLHADFRSAGLPVAVLEVDVANTGAQRFYQRWGYEQVETLRGYYNGGRDAYRMVCFLRSGRR